MCNVSWGLGNWVTRYIKSRSGGIGKRVYPMRRRKVAGRAIPIVNYDGRRPPQLPTRRARFTTGFTSEHVFDALVLFLTHAHPNSCIGGTRTGISRVAKNNVATPKNQSISPNPHHHFCGQTSDSTQSPSAYTTPSHSHRRSRAAGDRHSQKS